MSNAHTPLTIRGKYSAAPVFLPAPSIFLCPEDNVKSSLMLSSLVAGSCIGMEIVGIGSAVGFSEARIVLFLCVGV